MTDMPDAIWIDETSGCLHKVCGPYIGFKYDNGTTKYANTETHVCIPREDAANLLAEAIFDVCGIDDVDEDELVEIIRHMGGEDE